MESYKLPVDYRAKLILEKEYPKVKKEAMTQGILYDIIKAYREAASNIEIKAETKGDFNKISDLLRCFAGLNAARKKIGWNEICLEDLAVEKDSI